METNQIALEATIAAVGSKATYGGASVTVASWFMSSEFGVLMGMVIGIAGLITNFYFKNKEDKRRQFEHEHRMKVSE